MRVRSLFSIRGMRLLATSIRREARCGLMLVAAVLAAHAMPAGAQAPDAGQLLQQQQRAEPRREQRTPAADAAVPAPPIVAAPSTGAIKPARPSKVHVTRFRITDDAGGLFPPDELLDLVSDFVGRDLSFSEIEGAAAAVTRHYQDHGYFLARAYLPQQEITKGVVSIHVATGRIESGAAGEHLLVKPTDLRLREDRVRKTLARSVRDGEPVKLAELEQGVLLLNDLPGVTAKVSLAPGSAAGTARLEVDAGEGRFLTASAGADNHGYRHTGEERGSVLLSLNDPLGIGDVISLSAASAGSGMNYGRLAYQLPVGYRGFRTGAAISHLQYELGKELESLNASGKADTASLFASFPFVRSRIYNLSADLSLDYKKLFNEAAGTTTSDKVVKSATLTLSNDIWDNLLGGGVTSVGLSATYGRLALDDWPLDLALDRLTARTQGSYTKASLSLARQQRITRRLSLYVSASAQHASKNLDSSEKFTLGGATGVRAYPYGEASGDAGHLASAELRFDTDLPLARTHLRIFGFFDEGRIRLHQEPWNGWQGGNSLARNSYSLRGAGIGAMFVKSDRFSVRAAYARKVGSNPSPTATGTDSDGTNDKGRFWLQAGISFH